MSPQISPTELQDQSKFRLVEEFDHFDIFKFLSVYYYQKRSWIVYFHYLLSLAMIIFWLWFGIKAGYSLGTFFFIFGWSIVSMVVIFIPLHEIIQLIAYRMIGAQQVRFYFSFKKIYAFTIAYNFVIGHSDAIRVTLLPLIIIISALSIAIVSWESTRFYFLNTFVIYLGISSKNFAIINYYWLNRQKILYCYDSFDGRRYMYEKIQNRS